MTLNLPKIRKWALIGLLVVASVVRLYRIAATQTFLEDEGRDMLIVQRMIDTKLPVLLGPQTSTGNMYLGPLYYYFITPALILSHGDPIGPAVEIAISGVVTVALLYYLGKKWWGESAGFVASILYAVLPYPVMFSRNSWNPNLAPLIMALLLWAASEIKLGGKQKDKYRPVLYFGLLSGVLMQLHYMAMVGIGAVGIYVVSTNFKEWKRLLVSLGIGLVGLMLTLSPFLVFEVRNNFVNSRALFGFLSGTTDDNIQYGLKFSQWSNKVVETFRDIAAGQLGSSAFHPETAKSILSVILLVGLAMLLIYRRRIKPQGKMVVTTFIVSLLTLGFYQEFIHLHYLGFLLPIVYLFIGMASAVLPWKKIWIVAICGIVLYNLPTLYSYINSGPTHQVEKAKAIADYIATEAGDRPYNVVSRQLGQTAPFQYYLAQEKHRPSNNLETTLFIICDGTPCNKDDETTTLLYLAGPSHPTLANYLFHPQVNEFNNPRTMIKDEHVKFGIWVAQLMITKE